MRRLILLLMLALFLVSAVGVSAQTTFVNHTVARGETLAIIAARYGTTWQAIAQLNNLPNPNLIFAGQILVVPVGQVVPPPPPPPPIGQTTPYHVTWGDTLARIAGYYGTTWQVLAGLNGLANPNLIFAGQRLLAPVNASRTANYTVRRGDTLGNIAFRFNSSVAAITTRNGLVNPNLIFTGQFLAVPF
jgi:LysM repeat protein